MTALARRIAHAFPPRAFTADPPLIGLALCLAAIAILAPEQLWESARFVAASFAGTGPFLLASALIAAWATASRADRLVAAFFANTPPWAAIAGSAAIGALSPFCSCGVIPLIAALLKMGTPLPAVMAFWLASPLMDPSMFALTAGELGSTFALVKTASAIAVGLIGGWGAALAMRVGAIEPGSALRIDASAGCCGPSRGPVHWRFWREPGRGAVFARDAVSTTLFLGKWLALAFTLESLMVAYEPIDVAAHLGGSSLADIALAAALGVPLYLNGYAALPLIGGLIEAGMSPAVGLAFLLGGGVSSIPAALAVWALARARVFACYLAFAYLGALLSSAAFAAALA